MVVSRPMPLHVVEIILLASCFLFHISTPIATIQTQKEKEKKREKYPAAPVTRAFFPASRPTIVLDYETIVCTYVSLQ